MNILVSGDSAVGENYLLNQTHGSVQTVLLGDGKAAFLASDGHQVFYADDQDRSIWNSLLDQKVVTFAYYRPEGIALDTDIRRMFVSLQYYGIQSYTYEGTGELDVVVDTPFGSSWSMSADTVNK